MNNNKLIADAFTALSEKYQIASFSVADRDDKNYQTSDYDVVIKVSTGFISFRLSYHAQLLFVECTNRVMTNSTIRVLGELVAMFGPIIEK